MNFKGLFLAFILFFSGCSDFLKGKKSADHVITVEENEACLKKFPTIFEKFLESKIDGKEIDEALGCLNSTLTRFKNKFRGQQDKDVFSIDDITTIFNFFFKDLKISRDTSEKLVRFKFALIGGQSDNLSKVDVENLKEFLKDLSLELKNISKWVAVFRSDNGRLPESSINSAYGQLRTSLINLINSGHISKTQYSVEDFLMLLKQFNFNLKPYTEQIDQLLVVKKFLIGDDYVKTKESYVAAIELILDIMQLNAMIENQHFKFDLKNPRTQQSLKNLMKAVIAIIKKSPRMKTEKELHLKTIKELVKFESPLLSFENLLLIKVAIVGGNSDALTMTEVEHFEEKSQEMIAAAFKVASLLDLKTIDQFLAASEDLQSTVKLLFEVTQIGQALKTSNLPVQIFETLFEFLKAMNVTTSQIDFQSAFRVFADPGTFKSKENTLEFLKQITLLLRAIQDRSKNSDVKTISVQIESAKSILEKIESLIRLKNSPTFNVNLLFKSMNFSDENFEQVQGFLKLLFPQMKSTQINLEDIERLHGFLEVAEIELRILEKWPEKSAEFENFKKALKPLLAATDFYSNRIKTHDLILMISQFTPQQIGESNSIKNFLRLLISDREIQSFEEITSVLNSLFAAYQLSQKLSASKKFGLDFIQDFFSVLMASDAMQVGKKLDLNQLVLILESIPQAQSAVPQIRAGINYLSILFPTLKQGVAHEKVMSQLFAFILMLSKEKDHLAKWPKSALELKVLKESMERLLSATEFFSGTPKSHDILSLLINAALESSENFRNAVGKKKNLLYSVIQFLIADRELKNFDDMSSILETIIAGLELYNNFSKTKVELSGATIERVIELILKSDHMKVHDYVRFDRALLLIFQLDSSLFKKLDLQISQILDLKVNLLGGVSNELTSAELNNVSQLIRLFANSPSVPMKSIEPQRIVQFFTNPESIKVVAQMFKTENRNEPSNLSGIVAKVLSLAGSATKIKTEFEQALAKRQFKALWPLMNRMIEDLAKLPLLERGGTLDLQNLQSLLKESLDLDLQISPLWLQIKVYLVGGVAHQITRSELLAFQRLISFAQDSELIVFNSLQILVLNKSSTYSLHQINQAASVIKEKGLQFVQLTQISKAGITFPGFMKILQPVIKDSVSDLELNLIHTGHQLLVGSYFDYSPEHFRLLIDSYVGVLQVVRFAKLGFVRLEIKERNSFLMTMHALEVLFKVFENSIAFTKAGKFETKYFDLVLGYLLNKGIIPYKVSQDLLASFYKRMLNMVFSQPRVDSDQLEFITAQQFAGLKNELILFGFFIRVIDGAFTEIEYNSQNVRTKNQQLKLSIERQIAKNKYVYQSAFAHDPDFFRTALNVYKKEIIQSQSTVFANGYVVSPNQNDYFSSWADQMRAQYMRTLARLLLKGWGIKGGTEINSKGLVKWYADFKDFSIALKTFDPRSGNSGERSMREANLFTRSGNGDKSLNFVEATQYVSMLMTGGSGQFSQIYSLADRANCLTNQLDPVGSNYVKEACLISIYTQNYEQIFSNMDRFVRYIKNLKDNGERYQFFHTVMEVARNIQNKSLDLESLDVRTMNMILIYMESIFSVLDTDLNNTLSPNEIREGYARFESLVYEVAVKKSEPLLNDFAQDFLKGICRKFETPEKNKRYLAREVFIYLIYNGALPEQKDIFSWKRDKTLPLVKGTWSAVVNSASQAAVGIAEGAQTAWNCGVNDEIFQFDGEVDRKMMINTFKRIKSVLASE